MTSGHHWNDPGPAAEPQAAARQAGEGEKRKQNCRGEFLFFLENIYVYCTCITLIFELMFLMQLPLSTTFGFF